MPDKKRVAGTVDRIEGDAVVVVFQDPDSGETREAVVNKRQLKRIELKEGDPVTVELSMMEAGPVVTAGLISKKKPSATKPKKVLKSLSKPAKR